MSPAGEPPAGIPFTSRRMQAYPGSSPWVLAFSRPKDRLRASRMCRRASPVDEQHAPAKPRRLLAWSRRYGRRAPPAGRPAPPCAPRTADAAARAGIAVPAATAADAGTAATARPGAWFALADTGGAAGRSTSGRAPTASISVASEVTALASEVTALAPDVTALAPDVTAALAPEVTAAGPELAAALTPAVPAQGAAPAVAVAQLHAASIPAGPVPAPVGPAVAPPAPDVLNALHGIDALHGGAHTGRRAGHCDPRARAQQREGERSGGRKVDLPIGHGSLLQFVRRKPAAQALVRICRIWREAQDARHAWLTPPHGTFSAALAMIEIFRSGTTTRHVK